MFSQLLDYTFHTFQSFSQLSLNLVKEEKYFESSVTSDELEIFWITWWNISWKDQQQQIYESGTTSFLLLKELKTLIGSFNGGNQTCKTYVEKCEKLREKCRVGWN